MYLLIGIVVGFIIAEAIKRSCVLWFHKFTKWTEILTDGSVQTVSHNKQLKFQRRACERCGLIQRRNL